MKALACILLLTALARTSAAHQGDSTLVAPILQGIIIDGDLSDWPTGMEVHPVLNYGEIPNNSAQGNDAIIGLDLATSADFSPAFQVGYNPDAQMLYLAVTVRDDEHRVNYQWPFGGDCIEIYLDPDHNGGPHRNQPGAQHLQYSSIADSTGKLRRPYGSPHLYGHDITQTRSRFAFSRQDGITIYEWALDPFDHFPGQHTQLKPGRTLGFDIAVLDLDEDDGRAAWVCWATFSPNAKVGNADLLGDLILGHQRLTGNPMGAVAGQSLAQEGHSPLAQLDLEAVQQGQIVGLARSDKQGQFRFNLPPGEYLLRTRPGYGFRLLPKTVQVVTGQTTQADVEAAAVALPPILHKTAARYNNLTSYRDSIEVAIDGGLETATATFAWHTQNGLRLEAVDWSSGNQFTIYHDGQLLSQYSSQFLQYVQQEAPALAFAALKPYSPKLQQALTGLRLAQQLILADDPAALLYLGVESARFISRQRVQGRPTEIVQLDFIAVSGSLPAPLVQHGAWSLRLWLDSQTGAIARAAYELDGRAYTEYYHTADFAPSLEAAHFRFAPPLGATEALYLGEGSEFGDLVGQPAPEFSLVDPDGVPIQLADYAGKVVLIDFWGTWCPPCRQAMPHLNAWQKTYAERDFALVGIAVPPDQASHVRRYALEHQLTFPLPLADGKVRQQYQVVGYPSMFLVDRQGVVRYAHTGFAKNQLDAYIERINLLLDE
ncbi:MAG: redoxin domain-containing protein [Candidatus Latescibacteria bacterium]|nr:redoxin domain-containing protein [Candidatus Latescibacterota bacterium]